MFITKIQSFAFKESYHCLCTPRSLKTAWESARSEYRWKLEGTWLKLKERDNTCFGEKRVVLRSWGPKVVVYLLNPVLRNRNYFLRFRFRFWQVPVPTLDNYGSGSGPVSRLKKQFSNFFLGKILPFYIVSFFTRKKLIIFIKFIVKCERKKF